MRVITNLEIQSCGMYYVDYNYFVSGSSVYAQLLKVELFRVLTFARGTE